MIVLSGSCTDGDIRLVNGTLPSEGRVELCLSGIWGTVADDGWDKNAARVVCNQLGYASECKFHYCLYYVFLVIALRVCCGFISYLDVIDYHNSFYGLGEGAVHIEEISCQGDEPTLLNCSFITESTLEFHFNDAGVRCFNVTGTCLPSLA